MLTLGIDPGVSRTGYGLVRKIDEDLTLVEYGVIATESESPPAQRLRVICDELERIIVHHRPTDVAVERLFFSSNARTALAVGEARGVALLAAAKHDLPVYEYTPSEVKESLVGYGRATKGQVQELVKIVLGLDFLPEPDDAADALAVAICHLYALRPIDLLKQEG
ncbi:MAG: crossover junction endodeoxyribonuclease RuvC [Anaerolineae bacterium]|nr:crossover junction endodeoxyribonuclease RuvC [Anaerolineae bacterium]